MFIDMKSLDVIDCCRPLDADGLTDDDADATAAVFKALADPARVKIVNLLARTEDPVERLVRIPEVVR